MIQLLFLGESGSQVVPTNCRPGGICEGRKICLVPPGLISKDQLDRFCCKE